MQIEAFTVIFCRYLGILCHVDIAETLLNHLLLHVIEIFMVEKTFVKSSRYLCYRETMDGRFRKQILAAIAYKSLSM